MLPARDPVVRALGGLATGAAAGAATITTGLVVLRTWQGSRGGDAAEPGFTVLSVSVFVGMVVAGACGWLLSRGIVEAWRRGVTATLAVFGALMLSLLAIPADLIAGRGALVAYLMLLVAGALSAAVHARRAA